MFNYKCIIKLNDICNLITTIQAICNLVFYHNKNTVVTDIEEVFLI